MTHSRQLILSGDVAEALRLAIATERKVILHRLHMYLAGAGALVGLARVANQLNVAEALSGNPAVAKLGLIAQLKVADLWQVQARLACLESFMRSCPSRSISVLLLAALLVVGCSAEQSPTEISAPKLEVASPPPLQISPVLPPGSSMLAQKGERVAKLLGCLGCHGKDLHGKPWEDDPTFAVLYSSNLTRAIPRYTDAQLEHAIREGVRYDESLLWEMPSDAFLHLSAPDMQALIAYLRSVPQGGADHPRMVIGPGAEKEIRVGLFTPTADAVKKTRNVVPVFAGEQNAWGLYLAQTVCSECHGQDLRGDPNPEHFRPDLIAAASYTLTDFKTLLKTGQPTGNRKLGLMTKVSQSRFSHLTDPEVEAIHAYLVARSALPR